MLCKFVKTEYVHEKSKKHLCVCARIGCRRHGFSESPELLRAECMNPHFGLGDLAYVTIKVATLGVLSMCDNCLRRRLKMNKWMNWSFPNWFLRMSGLVRKLPWDDPLYSAKLKIAKV